MCLFPVDLQHRRGPLLPSALWVCVCCFPVLCVYGGSAWKRRTRTKKRTKKKGKKRAKRISTPKWMEVIARYMCGEETPHTHTKTHFALFACPLQMYRPCDVSVMTSGSPRSNKTVNVRYRMFCTFFMFLWRLRPEMSLCFWVMRFLWARRLHVNTPWA